MIKTEVDKEAWSIYSMIDFTKKSEGLTKPKKWTKINKKKGDTAMPKLINKTQGYTIINNSIMKDKNLSLKDRGLLCMLLSLPDNWDFSVLGLSKIIPDGKDAIRSSVQSLEEKGYLRRVQSKSLNGRFSGYDWIIYDTPIPSSDIPSTVSQMTDFATQEKIITNTDNQLINKSINRIDCDELSEMIGYDLLKDNSVAKDIYIVCESVLKAGKDIVINGTTVPLSVFYDAVTSLDYRDFLHIADQISSQAGKIRNIKHYILATVINTANTYNVYWAQQVSSQ